MMSLSRSVIIEIVEDTQGMDNPSFYDVCGLNLYKNW